MGLLKQFNLVKNSDGKAAACFEGLFPDFRQVPYGAPHEYVNTYWDKYLKTRKNDTLNGNIFEYIVETLLIVEGILPFYTQASMSFVPGISYDIILYHKDKTGILPIALSLKTSFRERWKQADLEAEALKNVHRKAKCFLLTLSARDANKANERIANGNVFGLEKAIDCTSSEIDDLIADLKAITFCESLVDIKAVESGRLII